MCEYLKGRKGGEEGKKGRASEWKKGKPQPDFLATPLTEFESAGAWQYQHMHGLTRV